MPITFESPYWTKEGVCLKHMGYAPCIECLDSYDQHIHASLDKYTIEMLRWGFDDEYVEDAIEDLKLFNHKQILFRKFTMCE